MCITYYQHGFAFSTTYCVPAMQKVNQKDSFVEKWLKLSPPSSIEVNHNKLKIKALTPS